MGWTGYDTWKADARRLSPDRHPSKARVHVYEARKDFASFRKATWAWIDDDPKVTGRWFPGGHLEEPYRTDATHVACIDWLARR